MTSQYNTELLKPEKSAIKLAAQLLKSGEIVGIPTETVYGLAASSLNDSAVAKIFKAKNRPCDNPLISHISGMDMMKYLCDDVPESALKLGKAFWPGPLTLIVKRGGNVCDVVCAGLDTVAVRMPAHPVALSIISAAGVPLAAPSANVSGRPSPTSARHVMLDMQGKIPLIIDGGECEVGLESTVISLVENTPVILRPGFVTKKQIENVLNTSVILASSIVAPTKEGEKISSPGMKYKHYAPKGEMVLVKGNKEQFCAFVNEKVHGFEEEQKRSTKANVCMNEIVSGNEKQSQQSGIYALCFEGEQQFLNCPTTAYGAENKPEELAKNLFAALRDLDDKGAEKIYAHCPKESGVGLAVYNRMLRAAAFKVVNLND